MHYERWENGFHVNKKRFITQSRRDHQGDTKNKLRDKGLFSPLHSLRLCVRINKVYCRVVTNFFNISFNSGPLLSDKPNYFACDSLAPYLSYIPTEDDLNRSMT